MQSTNNPYNKSMLMAGILTIVLGIILGVITIMINLSKYINNINQYTIENKYTIESQMLENDNNYNENNYDNSESIETPSVEENNNNITIEDAQEEIQTEQQDTIDAENTSYNTQVPIDENSSYVTSKKLSIDELQQLRTEFANMQFEQTTEEQSMIR